MTKVLMNGTTTVNLMAYTKDAEKFKRLINKHTLIDAKMSFYTCEGETIIVDVFEFISELEWQTCCTETGESLEEVEVIR